ncbi:tenascin-R-like [Oculina patagonica]
MTRVSLGFLFSFLFFATLVASNPLAKPAVKSTNGTSGPIETQKCNNVYFYEAPHKNTENLLQELNERLIQIQDDIEILKGNKTSVKPNRNCAELYKSGQRISGVYTIDPDGSGAFDVYCDQTTAGGGWTVFQKRLDGSVDFYRGWADYKRGFGNLNGEFWLGLDKVNRLTKTTKNELRVDLEDTAGKTAYAEYDMFAVTSERTKYQLSLGTYSAKKNCAEVYKSGERISGVYTIDPDGSGAFDVFCDQTTAGGGWTVFQKRLDGSVSFFRDWTHYKNGFGNLNGEFWLGLDKIHPLTKTTKNRLRVDLEDTAGKTAYADYDMFAVTSERTKYQLSIGTYSGTSGDSLSYARGYPFSTKDQDNDTWSNNCAVSFKGAWWYADCHPSNLNGVYHHGAHTSFADGVNW